METTTKRKQLRIYALEDLEIERKKGNVWITRNGKVYDVTTFVDDHPGGDDLIRQFAGKDIGEAMEDEEEHVHSDSAYTMLEEYLVGKLGKDGQVVSDDWVAEDDFHPDDTNVDDDYLQTEFLDLRKPLIRQMWEGNFSKSFYLQQVHQPRHLADSARLFGPEYLEIFTKTKWYVVPIVWLPISCYLFFRSSLQFSVAMPLGANNNNNTMTPHTPSFYLTQPVNSPQTLLSSFPTLSDLATVNTTAWSLAIASFFLGNFVWTLLEYGFHRFLFHVDRLLPDKPAFLLIHFLTHGV
ncbi:fatty acid alpha-hydroxylase, partial [Serendipita sp. 405]